MFGIMTAGLFALIAGVGCALKGSAIRGLIAAAAIVIVGVLGLVLDLGLMATARDGKDSAMALVVMAVWPVLQFVIMLGAISGAGGARPRAKRRKIRRRPSEPGSGVVPPG